jgi:hypothetical protein
MARFRVVCLGAALGLVSAAPATAQELIDLYGVTQATMEWSPASGPVAGYYVIVARDGGTPALQGVSNGTRATVESPFGATLVVQVAAFDAAGVAGTLSPPSSAIRFNPLPSSGGEGGDPTAPDPVGTDPDPPAAGDPAPGEGAGDTTPPAPTRFDFTGDGPSDVLLRDPRSGELVLWTMQRQQVTARSALAHLPYPWSLAESGDYDGDGTADLLWRNARTGQLIVWLIREGGVAEGAGLELGTSRTRDWAVAGRGDFDGDGRDDIALARPRRGAVDLLLMDGSAVAARVTRRAPGDRWRLIATPDADGDGAAELVWENVDSHALSIEWMSAPGQAAPLVSQPGDWRVLGSGDLDGDGRDDLLVRERGSRRVQAWLLDGDRVTRSRWSATLADRHWTYRGLGDFDGDGRADSFWHHAPTRTLEIWLATPAGVERAAASESTAGDKVVGDEGD